MFKPNTKFLASKLSPSDKATAEAKEERVGKEFKNGQLHSGSPKGPLVTNRKQALAIMLSEAQKAVSK